MSDFINRFGQHGTFTPARMGCIVAFLVIGAMVGSLCAGKVCDKWGRRKAISWAAWFYLAGVIIQVTSMKSWVQFSMGRLIAGLGLGVMSTCVPIYQAESVPKNIRGVVTSSYQLTITMGIWIACLVSKFNPRSLNSSLFHKDQLGH
jgi:SP family sugar:H+ symporter-like MFS transporter